ncbi:MAG: hypothetical protein HY763_03450 [Planctomycetes bacterium]|nr:hypothetical protein [Planctomycetota bacterium]
MSRTITAGPQRCIVGLLASLYCVGLLGAGSKSLTTEPAENPAPTSVPAEPAGPDAARINEILERLEKRSDDIKDIRCDVRFVEDDRINLSKRTKRGRIIFLLTEENPNFLVHFDKIESDGVAGKQEWYLFDGRWLLQAMERLQQVTRQEVAREGERVDLFDLERAPFPLPFGQKKEQILRNFDVTLAPPSGEDPSETDHLVCIPKPGSTMDRRYDKLEFFVRRDINLPGRVVATKSGGLEINTADFPDLSPKSLNAGVSKKDLSRPAAWKGYKEVVEPLAD